MFVLRAAGIVLLCSVYLSLAIRSFEACIQRAYRSALPALSSLRPRLGQRTGRR